MVRGERTIEDDTRDRRLTVVSGVNVRDLPIGPSEAFVLSRIDGFGSQADIVALTGMAEDEVAEIVARLIALGAVQSADASARGSLVAPSQTMRSGAYSIPLAQQARAEAPPELSLELELELEEVIDLSAEQRRLLTDWDERCTKLDHYELLGVIPTADPKAVRAAYYELVRVYHPDRFFGKRLGSFQAPLLRVFGKFTEAYEALRKPQSRADYDRYSLARQRTRELDRFFDSAGQSAPPSASAAPPASAPPESLLPPSGTQRRPSSAPVSDPDARRRALARKLGHSSAPPARPTSSAPPDSAASSRAAADELKRRLEHRKTQVRDAQREHYVTLAKEASERNDLIAAANALRVACSLDPDNLELAGDLAELERSAAAGLWEAYLERAKYAAVEGRLDEAAEAYGRAALGRPSASLLERAAFYTVESGGDSRRASQLAKQAVALAPNSARCRLTLAQAYAAGRLLESALAELERARALEPNQPLIKEWIARVKRGDV